MTETTIEKAETSAPATNGADKPLTAAEKIRALELAKGDREKRRREEEEANTLEVLELESKFESTTGVRGIDFEILDLSVKDSDGAYVGRLGPPVVLVRAKSSIIHKKYTSGKITEVTTYDYVTPHVEFPKKEDFVAVYDKHPVVLTRCANALVTLYGAKSEERGGK